MVSKVDLYVPGTVRQSADGFQFEYEGVRVPLDGSEKLQGAEGDDCTVGMVVDIESVEPVEEDETLGVHVDDGQVTLVGEEYKTGYFYGRGQQAHYYNLALEPGIWPVKSDDGLRKWVAPLDDHREADRVRVSVHSLTVVEVLRGEDDPFAEQVRDLHFEFGGGAESFQLFVGETQLWPREGWYESNGGRDCAELALGMLGEWAREAVGGAEASLTNDPFYDTGLVVEVEDGLARLQVGSTDRAIGPWPRDGVRIETDALIRAWARDTNWYLSTREDDHLEDILEDVREFAPELTADIESEQPFADPEAVPLSRLYAEVASSAASGRDALSVLQDRIDDENAPAVGEFLLETELPEESTCVLVERLGAVGGLDSVRQLVRFAESTATQTLRSEALEAIERSPPATVAAAMVLETFDRDVDAMLSRLDEVDGSDTGWVPDGEPPCGIEELVDRLLAAISDEDEVWKRQLFAYGLRSFGEAAEPRRGQLLETMSREPSGDVREHLRDAAASWTTTESDHAVAEAMAVCESPTQRRELFEGAKSGRPPTFLREWLNGEDFERRAAAARSAPAFTEALPYEGLVETVVKGRERGGKAATLMAKDARRALGTLADNESAPIPPAELSLQLCEASVEARGVALDFLVQAAMEHDGGDFFGVDPERLHNLVFETQRGNAKPDIKRMGILVGATLDRFDPDTLQVLPTANLQRAVVHRTVDYAGVSAESMLREVRADADDKMVRMCDWLLEKIETARQDGG